MAPTTRLKQDPQRRVDYSNLAGASSKVKKCNVTPKKPVAYKECTLCFSRKNSKNGFGEPGKVHLCAHLRDICKTCIENMILSMVVNRNFSEAQLACPFSCGSALDFMDVKKLIRPGIFTQWDDALAKHHIRSNSSYITCMSTKCGHYFSADSAEVGCNSKHADSGHRLEPELDFSLQGPSRGDEASRQATKLTPRQDRLNQPGKKAESAINKADINMISCPHCAYQFCFKCKRSWHSGKLCDKAKLADDKKSEEAIGKMGAKSCPKCTVIIKKEGGCDHMKCSTCHHHFCWQCLVPFTSDVQHAEGCSHHNHNIVQDIRNFWQGPINQLPIMNGNARNDQMIVPLPELPDPLPRNQIIPRQLNHQQGNPNFDFPPLDDPPNIPGEAFRVVLRDMTILLRALQRES